MALLLMSVKTEIRWLDENAKTPFLGGLLLFVIIFIPAVIASFIAQALIPGLHDDPGFTKAMLLLLPVWNLMLWLKKIKLYLFYLPAWILLGGIALIKVILFITGVENEL